jgi:phospholipid-transporting ATPase
MVAGIVSGILLWFLSCPVNELVNRSIGTFSSLSGSASELFGSSVFWALILFVPVLVIARDFLWKFYRRQFRPHSYHIIQELRLQKAAPVTAQRPLVNFFKSNSVFIGDSPKATVDRGFTFSQSRGQSMVLEAYGQSPTISTNPLSLPKSKKDQNS